MCVKCTVNGGRKITGRFLNKYNEVLHADPEVDGVSGKELAVILDVVTACETAFSESLAEDELHKVAAEVFLETTPDMRNALKRIMHVVSAMELKACAFGMKN